MGQDNIAYERELGNINIRGKRGKNKVHFGVKPVAAEVHQGKIDSTDIPLHLDVELDDVVVEAKDKSKPWDLGIKPVEAEVDTRKIDKDIPLYVATPTTYGGELPEVIVEGQHPKQPTTEEANAKRVAYAEKLMEMVTPYMMGPQASEETVNKSHSIYDIEKEKQAARDKEKEEANELGRLYVEGRKYGLDKLMEEANAEPSVEKPVVDENVEIIDDTLEKEAMPSDVKAEKAKEEDPLKFLSDYVNNLWTKEDEEAAAKKKKAAQWILAAQMLGDSIGALSNVYWTGKGANAMKLEPGAPKAAAATYQLEQDIRNAREKAAKAKMDATLKKYELEMKNRDADRAQANADRAYELQRSQFDANEAYRKQQQQNFETTEARLAEQARLNAENEKKRIDIAKQNANIQLKNALDKNKPYPMAVNGEIYEIPIKKINEQIIGSIFAKLPEEVRMSAGSPRYGKDAMNNSVIVGYNNPILTDMLAAIGTYGNEETAKEIMKLAGVKVEEVNPKKDERKKENTPTNTTEPPIQAYNSSADEWSSQWRRRAGLEQTDFSQYKRK